MEKKTIPSVSIEGLQIAKRLGTMQPGETVSYQELSALVGRDVQCDARHSLYAAQKYVLRDHNMVFAAIRNVGVRRLPDGEIANVGHQGLQRIRRTAQKGVHKLSCVQDFGSLTMDQQVRHNTAMSLLAVFYEIAKPSGLRRIEQHVKKEQKSLPLGQTLELFRVV